MGDDKYEDKLAADPGDPLFVDYALICIERNEVGKALEVCLSGLSRNPGLHRGRLALAKVFYLSGHLPFAIRELKELHLALPNNRSIIKLLEKFGVLGEESLGFDKTQKEQGNLKAQRSSASMEPSETPGDETAPVDETVAEVEFDFDALQMLKEEKES